MTVPTANFLAEKLRPSPVTADDRALGYDSPHPHGHNERCIMFRKIRNVIETLVAELRNENYYSIAQQMRDSDAHSDMLENLIDEYSADNNALNAELDSLRDEIESLRDELDAINAD